MDRQGRPFRVNDITLQVLIKGEGPAVLLIHGFPDTGAVWRKQVPVLVGAGYRVIVPDTRGRGRSEAPAATHAYALEHLVADLVALLDALGIAQVRLVAHDWGAVIGWQLCIWHPDRVERYVALSVGHPTAYARGPVRQKLMGWYVLFFQWRGFAEWALRANQWWLFRRWIRYDAECPRWIADLSRPGRLTAALNYYRANLGLFVPRTLPPVPVPVMGVWSSGDIALCEEQMTASKAYVTAPFRYERLDGVNHWIPLSAPATLNALLLDYLR